LYVIDATALNAVQSVGDPGAAFNELTNLVQASELVYCREVRDELRRIALNEPPHMWAQANWVAVRDSGAPLAHIQWSVRVHGSLVDPDVDYELPGPYVLAQAHYLQTHDDVVTVVTEEFGDLATRAALGDVCLQAGFDCINLANCFTRCGGVLAALAAPAAPLPAQPAAAPAVAPPPP
jgi:hypothetical protein